MPTTQIRHLPIIYGLLAAATLVLLWFAREQPLVFGLVRLDGVSLFFLLLAFLAPLLNWDTSWRTVLITALMVLALTSRLTPVIAVALALAATTGLPRVSRLRESVRFWHTPAAISCLLIGYGLLAARGAWLYDARNAGAALDSLAFWFVLLAVVTWTMDARRETKFLPAPVLFLYPLVRLYTFGSWNPGWALAAILFGGVVALWHAYYALTRPTPVTPAASAMLAATALACFGLASSAGIVAGSYAALASVLLARSSHQAIGVFGGMALVFAACWMAVGAAVAGGVAALAGTIWVAALLAVLALVLRSGPVHIAQHLFKQMVALVAVILAPLLVQWLIEPAVTQLQGRLTPYGDVVIWPWIGLAFVNSAQAQVAVLPSIAVAILMLVLVSLVFLLTQLRSQAVGEGLDTTETDDYGWLWSLLREEVPWLGGKRDRGAE